MPPEPPDLARLAARLERIVDRLGQVAAQVRGLVTSPTVGAQEIVVRDARSLIRARLGMGEFAPCLTCSDPGGKERLKIGFRTDSSPCSA